MIRRGNSIRVIKGMVFTDLNGNGIQDSHEKGLENVKIRLFRVRNFDSGSIKGNDDSIAVLNQKLVSQAVTNEKGEYRFDAENGIYVVNVDVNTLPLGKGVVESDIYVNQNSMGDINFVVKEAVSIEPGKLKKTYYIGDDIDLNPVARDRDGSPLLCEVTSLPYGNDVSSANAAGIHYRDLKPVKIDIQLSSGEAVSTVSLDLKVPETDSVERIAFAFRNNIIDEKTKIYLYLQALFNKDSLSRSYESDKTIKSGTTAIHEIYDYIRREGADRSTVDAAKRYISRSIPPLDRVYNSASGYFKIHYTTSSTHSVGGLGPDNKAPDYIKLIGDVFDNVKSVTCGNRGFRVPIIDAGKNGFDIYVYDLGGKYGYTAPISYYCAGSGKQRRASCYICVDNNYEASKGFVKDRDDCMKVTAAHEFFHAVQYAYNVNAHSWWKEATSTWNEDEIYDGVNDYVQYLNKIFSNPEKPLDERSYDGVAFVKYLSEHKGGYQTVRRVWELLGEQNIKSIDAIDTALKAHNANDNIGKAFSEFTACNYNPVQYYKDGALWPSQTVFQNTYTEYPVKESKSYLNHLSANYQLFKPYILGTGSTLRIVIDGSGDVRWGFKLQKKRIRDNLCETADISANGKDNRTEILINYFGKVYNEICLIPANIEKEKDRCLYTYSARIQ